MFSCRAHGGPGEGRQGAVGGHQDAHAEVGKGNEGGGREVGKGKEGRGSEVGKGKEGRGEKEDFQRNACHWGAEVVGGRQASKGEKAMLCGWRSGRLGRRTSKTKKTKGVSKKKKPQGRVAAHGTMATGRFRYRKIGRVSPPPKILVDLLIYQSCMICFALILSGFIFPAFGSFGSNV